MTNNVITSQVATALLRGLFPQAPLSSPSSHIVYIQPSTIDSLEPTYSCPSADSLRQSYASSGGTNATVWTNHLVEARELYDALDKVSGIDNPDTAGWHDSFDQYVLRHDDLYLSNVIKHSYYDNLSAKECHGKKLPCCVNDTSLCITREQAGGFPFSHTLTRILSQADTVYRIGNWEYSYMFRDAPDSAAYSSLRYGAWVREVKSRLENKIGGGSSELKYVHNVAHDGSIAPLLGILQIAEMVWPGM